MVTSIDEQSPNHLRDRYNSCSLVVPVFVLFCFVFFVCVEKIILGTEMMIVFSFLLAV